MKTSFYTPFIIALAFIFSIPSVQAQVKVCTTVTVQGTYADRIWLITYPGTTQAYDNGWDGYKMFGNPLCPQFYIIGTDATNLQINTFEDVNNTVAAFVPGMDSVYTMSFTHYDVALRYSQLYLVDLVANKTIDIFPAGVTYEFTSRPGDRTDRFRFYSSMPQVVTEPPVVVTDTVAVTPPYEAPDTVVVVPPVVVPDTVVVPPVVVPDTIVVVPPVVVPDTVVVVPPVVDDQSAGNSNNHKKDKKDKKGKNDLKMKQHGNNLVIDNNSNKRGNLKIVNARTGKVAQTLQFSANGQTTLPTDIAKGLYIVNGTTETESVSMSIVIK